MNPGILLTVLDAWVQPTLLWFSGCAGAYELGWPTVPMNGWMDGVNNTTLKLTLTQQCVPQPSYCYLLCWEVCEPEGLPADPVAWDAVQSKQSKLKVVCGARSFFAALPLHLFALCCSLGQRRRAKRHWWGTEWAQVEFGQVVDCLRQQGDALLHRTGATCCQCESFLDISK